MIPSFAYPGGKAKIRKCIIAILPPEGRRYVEPFAGRGNVFFAVATLLNYQEFWLNDAQTFDFFDGLRHSLRYAVPDWKNPETFSRMKRRVQAQHDGLIRTHKIEVISADLVRPDYVDGYLRGDARIIHRGERPQNAAQPAPLLEPYLAFSGGTYEKAGQRAKDGNGVSRDGFERKVRKAHAIIRRTKPKLTRLDYREVLSNCNHDDVVYLDPPYLDNCDVRAYTDGMLDHQEMVRILKKAPYRWVLSEYEHPIYVRAFGTPTLKIECQKIIKSNAIDRGKKSHRAVECLWRNF